LKKFSTTEHGGRDKKRRGLLSAYEQTSKIDTMRKAAKPGDNKSMPPQPSTAPGTARWFIPGVGGAETSNFLDGCGNKQYHKATPFRK
jgi:hypothetical protein